MMASKNTLWVLRGDPAFGGSLDNLSYDIGIISRFAWARSPENTVLFLSSDGLYMQPYGASQPPVPVGDAASRKLLVGVDPTNHETFIEYSKADKGFWVFVCPKTVGVARHYFVYWPNKSLWPMGFVPNHGPAFAYSYKPETLASEKILLGGYDGWVRTFNDAASVDDEVDEHDLNSHVVIGPIPLGASGLLDAMEATIATGSDDVDWSIKAADAPEELRKAPEFMSGTFDSDGLSYVDRVRMRGTAAAIKLSSTGRWAMEGIEINRLALKKRRKS